MVGGYDSPDSIETPSVLATRASIDREKQTDQVVDSSLPQYKRPIPTWQWISVCTGLYLGGLLYGLDTTIAADVQGPILKSLGEIEKLPWVGIGFPMGSVSVILLFVWCYGLFEIKYQNIISVLLFEIGSAICGSAPNMDAMIFGRVIAGIGGAGMYLSALTYISVFTSMKERPIYNALMGLCWGSGCILGPLIGGGFAVSSATWRWAFYINLPLAAATSPIYVFLFPKYNPKSEVSGSTKLKQIDWVGAAFNASLFTLFQIVLTFSGSTWKWNSAGPIAIWILLGLIVIAWGFQQTYSIFTTPEHRLFPVQFVKSRSMLLLFIATAGTSTGMSVAVYFLPLFFQFTRGDSAIQAAVRLLPFICIFIFFVMLSGALLPVMGRYQPFYIISGIFLAVGAALMHTVNASTSTSEIYGFEVLMAIGAGFTMQSGYSIAAAKVQEHEIQSAIGFINIAQIGTGAICLSIAGNIFQNVGFINVRNALASYNISESEIRAALGGAQSVILSSTGDATMRKLALDAIIQTMQSIWILSLTGGAVVLVCGILMRSEKLNLSMTAGG